MSENNEMTQQMAKTVFTYVKEVLEEREISNEIKEDGADGKYVVIINYRGDDTSHRMVIRINADIGILTFFETMYFSTEENALPALAEACSRINYSLLLGTFSIDYSDNTVNFYNPLIFNNSILSKETVEEYLMRSVSIIEEYDDRLGAVNKGYMEASKVVTSD